MHKELLSDNERKLLNNYLTKGEKGQGFRLLKFRMTKYTEVIEKDLELIQKAQNRLSADI